MGAILQDLLAVRDALGLCWLGNLGWLLRAGERLVAFDLDLDRPCKGAKVRVRSSAAPIDVVERSAPAARGSSHSRSRARARRLKAGTPVRALSVVVRDILGQDRAQAPLVKGDHVVETL